MSVPGGLLAKRSDGSAGPDAVRSLLADQETAFDALEKRWQARRAGVDAAAAEVDRLLAGPEGRQEW